MDTIRTIAAASSPASKPTASADAPAAGPKDTVSVSGTKAAGCGCGCDCQGACTCGCSATAAAVKAIAAPAAPAAPSLQGLLPDKPFYLSSERVNELKTKTGMSTEQLLQALVPVAKSFARPPVSQYLVGAAGLGKSGAVYLGVNLEFPQQALNQTVHGEQCVTANAMAHGETALTMLAVSAAPCGHCRQFLNELDNGGELTVLTPNDPARKLKELLPSNFGPQDLGVKGGLLSPQDNKLQLDEPRYSSDDAVATVAVAACAALVGGLFFGPVGFAVPLFIGAMVGSSNRAERDEELSQAALDAANKSYAPYSHDPSGIAIRTEDGKVYAGSYAENAAFNPSLSPLQSALVNLVADGKSYTDIGEVVLVEKASAATEEHEASQEEATRALLSRIAPDADLAVYDAVQK